MILGDFQSWEIGGIAVAILVAVGGAVYSSYRITYCKGKNDNNQENRLSLIEAKVQENARALEELSETVQTNKEKIASIKGTLEGVRDNIDTLIKTVSEKQ